MADQIDENQKEIIRQIVAEARSQGIDPHFALAVAGAESNYKHVPANDKNSSAYGPFQVNRGTAEANGYNYDDMVKDQNLAIKAGVANLVRHAQNPDLGGDPVRIAAAHHYGEHSAFATSGDEKLLDKEGAQYLADIGSRHPDGQYPDAVYTKPEQNITEKLNQEKNPSPSELTRGTGDKVQDWYDSLNDFEKSALWGAGGALTGFGVGLTKYPLVAAINYLKPKESAAPSVGPTIENAAKLSPNSSEWNPPEVRRPTAGSASSQQTAFENTIQGNIKDTGATGTANRVTSNLGTAREAAITNKHKAIAAQMGLSPDEPLINHPAVGTTPTGQVVVTRDLSEQLHNEQLQTNTAKANQAVAAAQAEKARQTNLLNKVGQQAQEMFARAAELERAGQNSLANALREKAMQIYKNGLPLPSFMKTIPGAVSSVFGGAASQIPKALEDVQKQDYQGAAKDIGTGAAIGAGLSFVPKQMMAPLNALTQGYDAFAREHKGDYLGAGLSAVGAVAPFIARNPVTGVGTAVAAPVANAALDYYKAHPELREQLSENAQFLGP